MRAYLGFIFIGLYIGWVFYRLFIKKDLKKHMNDFYALSFFAAVWVLIMYMLFF